MCPREPHLDQLKDWRARGHLTSRDEAKEGGAMTRERERAERGTAATRFGTTKGKHGEKWEAEWEKRVHVKVEVLHQDADSKQLELEAAATQPQLVEQGHNP
ncbi:hypothetical protein L7F22_010817 [Adiantum nelumboides]|nr:hypothetical protein [Adiantum nelumboides]